MKTIPITLREMQQHIARFKDLTPSKNELALREDVPVEAYEYVAAKTIFTLLSGDEQGRGGTARAAAKGPTGSTVYIVETPPGNGPKLHAHMRTIETFVCLQGRYRFRFGERGCHETIIEPFDLISVPRGVNRGFENVGDELARMLVIIQGDDGDALNDVLMQPEQAEHIGKTWGADVLAGMERLGMRFDGDA